MHNTPYTQGRSAIPHRKQQTPGIPAHTSPANIQPDRQSLPEHTHLTEPPAYPQSHRTTKGRGRNTTISLLCPCIAHN
eukprot:11124659-Heterocapsa_arctica.AAC.1